MSETISPKTALGQYAIVSKIGEGGMGEVWRARDPRLGRDVAIKILPADFSRHTDRLNRFEQEARATSALNHPNIVTVYDIGEHKGSPYIVSELLDGEELRDRLNHGSLSVRKAIDYAQQIANGLCAAHEKGIVHRDLKPENLFITKDERVKILDFGIAKLTSSPTSTNPDISEDATRKVLTNPGMVIGTVGYMSPEQVRGQTADHRSDIFSFGAILHEMITGRRAFRRETMAETMTAILKEEPEELSASNPNISPALERIVNRCLEKKPERRFQSTADLGFALEALSAPTSSASGGNLTIAAHDAVAETKRQAAFKLLPWIIAGACLLALIIALPFAIKYFRQPRTAPAPAASFLIGPPEKSTGFQQFAISPDGQNIAFVAQVEGKNQVWLRPLNSLSARPIAGTEGVGGFPFWSQDGRAIIFLAASKVRKVDLADGTVQSLWDHPADVRGFGGTSNREGTILIFHGGSGILRAAPGPAATTALPGYESTPDRVLRWPNFLPDGRHFLFLVNDLGEGKSGVYVGSLDSREQKLILATDSSATFAPSADGGRLLFVRDGALLAQPFDPTRLELSGEPIRISEHVRVNNNGRAFVSASDNGVLVYDPSIGSEFRALTWFDRSGKQIDTVGQPGFISRFSLSLNQKFATITRLQDKAGGLFDLLVVEIARGASSRLNSDSPNATEAVWSPDGSRVIWSERKGPVYQLKQKLASGAGQEEVLFQTDHIIAPTSWSPDGKFIFFTDIDPKTIYDIWVLPLEGDRKPSLFFASPSNDSNAALSPDGKFVAYQSGESGRDEIYVQTFPASADKWTISTNGGIRPRWRRDGHELFYVASDGKVMSVDIKTDGGLQAGIPKPLFDLADVRAVRGNDYDVSPDGQRFLFISRMSQSDPSSLTVSLNWMTGLKK
jgi:Tol biopolymer transport system component